MALEVVAGGGGCPFPPLFLTKYTHTHSYCNYIYIYIRVKFIYIYNIRYMYSKMKRTLMSTYHCSALKLSAMCCNIVIFPKTYKNLLITTNYPENGQVCIQRKFSK